MTITAIRYRTEGALVVLQVQESTSDRFFPNGQKVDWRDAKVEDMLDVAGHVTKERVVYVPSANPQLSGDYGYGMVGVDRG